MGICLINFILFRPIPLFLFYIYHFDLDDLPSNFNTKFNVVIADLRAKDSSDIIRKLSLLIEDSGILILGSIDDIDEGAATDIQAGSELRKKFERIPLRDNEALFPHIYQETVNKHQYAMSFLSAWRKRAVDSAEEERRDTEKDNKPRDAVEYYEDKNILNSYDLFHFGEGLLSVKNFPLRFDTYSKYFYMMYVKYNVYYFYPVQIRLKT